MFIYHEVASLVRLRPTLRTQLTLLYAGLLAALGGSLLFLLIPLQGSASVEAGPHSAAVAAALNTSIRQKEIIGAIALPVVVLLALAGGWPWAAAMTSSPSWGRRWTACSGALRPRSSRSGVSWPTPRTSCAPRSPRNGPSCRWRSPIRTPARRRCGPPASRP